MTRNTPVTPDAEFDPILMAVLANRLMRLCGR